MSRRIRFKYKPYIRIAAGPEKRINLLRNLITALVKYERIELGYTKAFETQKYAERLIHIAKRGDKDPEAMKIADFWLKDKKQVHKLFKVLGPRYESTSKNFTRLLRIPGFHEDTGRKLAFLEYVGNPYPALTGEPKRNPGWILNVLVQGAVKELRDSKVLEEIEVVSSSEKQYQENLDGLQYEVDRMSLRDLTESGVSKSSQQTSVGGNASLEKSEGTPV